MRKFILITAMVLASATAQAGGSRSLTLASNDQPAAAEPPSPLNRRRPSRSLAEAAEGRQRSADLCRAARGRRYRDRSAEGRDDKARHRENHADEQQVEKPKRRRESTEARVIRELHRHGIYW